MEVREIPVEAIVSNGNPRKRFVAIRELATSIEAVGLLQPIVVQAAGDGYELVAGERRLRAFQLLERDTISAIEVDYGEVDGDGPATSALRDAVTENVTREDLTPLEEGQAFLALSDAGMSVKDVAAAVGKSQSYVRTRRKLSGLSEGEYKKVAHLPLDEQVKVAELAATPDVLHEVVESVRESDRSAQYHIRQKQEEARVAELWAELEPKIVELRELLGDRLYLRPEENSRISSEYNLDWANGVPRSWHPVGKNQRRDAVPVSVNKHRSEPCHVVTYTERSDFIVMAEYCNKKGRHNFAGASELKVPDAAEAAAGRKEKLAASKARKVNKQARMDAYRVLFARRFKAVPVSQLFAWSVIRLTDFTTKANAAFEILGLETPAESYAASRVETLHKWADESDKQLLSAAFACLFASDPGKRLTGDFEQHERPSSIQSVIEEFIIEHVGKKEFVELVESMKPTEGKEVANPEPTTQ
jgi:ParB family chromosome partitioning protein